MSPSKYSNEARTALVSIGFLAAIACGCPADSPRSTEPLDFQTHLERFRPVELRLTNAFGHAGCSVIDENRLVPVVTCRDGDRDLQIRQARRLRRLIARGPDSSRPDRPGYLRSRSLLDVVRMDKSATDRAVEGLREATRLAPDDPVLWNDLAAVSHSRVRWTDQPLDLVSALSAAERAVALDPSLAEAQFNRAVLLGLLRLDSDAIDGWQRYLEMDADSPWAAEARRRMEGVIARREGGPSRERSKLEGSVRAGDVSSARKLASNHPQRAREMLERELLPEWADHTLGGDEERARAVVEVMTAIAAGLSRRGDLLSSEGLEALTSPSTPARTRSLAQGHRELAKGFRDYRLERTEEALRQFRDAAGLLGSAKSPFARWATFYQACAAYQAHRYRESLERLEALDRRLDPGALALRAHVQWMFGLNRLLLGNPARSLEHYRQAQEAFLELGEVENVAAMDSLLGEAFDYLDQTRQTWTAFYRGLLRLDQITDPWRQFLVQTVVTDAALKLNELAVAELFQNEVVASARDVGSPSLLANALVWRAWIRHLSGRDRPGSADLEEARRLSAEIPDASVRDRRLADIAALEGATRARETPAEALKMLDEALAFYDRQEQRLAIALQTRKTRARLYAREGRLADAEADLVSAIQYYEERAEASPKERWLARQRVDEVFGTLAAFYLDTAGDPEKAFLTLERQAVAKLPSLHRAAGSGSQAGRPLGLSEIQARIPSRTTIVQFSFVAERMVIWRIGRSSFRPKEVETSPAVIRELLRNLWQGSAQRDRARFLDASSKLYAILVAPWIHTVARGDLICLVPAAGLHRVPWAALRSPADQRFFVEDHAFTVAPSSSYFLQATDLASIERERPPLDLLAVGDPTFDPQHFPMLGPLPAARTEASRIADRYPRSELLLDRDATRSAFLRLAPQAAVVHFAGHALGNEERPELAMLVSAAPEEVTYADDLIREDLGACRLIFLSACSSGVDETAGEAGISALAQAVLSAGCPTLVATLDLVADASMLPIATAFHRGYAAGLAPSAALRRAQLTWLSEHTDDLLPATWALVQVYGSSSENPEPAEGGR